VSSYIAEVAEMVKDELQGNVASDGFSQDFAPVRVYTSEADYKDVTSLIVLVFARVSDRTRETRATVRKDIEINVTFAKRIDQLTDPSDPAANPQLDEMMQLGEEIADFIALNGPRWTTPIFKVETDPIFDFEYLRSHRVFVGLIKAFCMRS
jgi:hypothetical protein